ncbi:MAG TPA: biotin/lipoyl-containing protein, partial [Stellaceae bacterium]|nr:biotin/lipoyl-containing protein [Stellaceae bacterium]
TVEFIVDPKRNFYFLEMNTRLQVEHPVTECVTGLDLVEWMIRIAAGEKLPFGQKDIKHTGHAIEARVYAEDPARGFLPSIGRLVRYREPHGDGVRVDSGVYEGAEIGIHYDPMIAKTVGFGADRETASARLVEALDAFVIRGVTNNIGFLAALLERPRFAEGRLTTNFIAEEFPGGAVHLALPQGAAPTLRAVAAVVAHLTAESEASIGGQLAGHAPPLPTEWAVMLGESRALVRVEPIDDGYAVTEDGKRRVVLQDWRPGEPLFRGTVDGEPVIVQVDRDGAFQRLTYRGVTVPAKALSPRAADLLAAMPAKAKPDLSRALRSPMPGLLVSIAVKPGQGVKAGEELAVVEAMKMENVLRAERDATVGKLCANPGDSLAVDQVILEFA